MKKLYILAGANGSGKSTIARVLLPSEGVVYVNPDDIARELCPDDLYSVRIEAGKEAIRRVDALLNAGQSFAIESTLSGYAYVRTLEHARALGYDTTIAYVFVDSVDVCLARIAARVKRGGHDIPPADVQRRYARSKSNFINIYAKLANHWMLYYNGGTDVALVAHGNGEREILIEERYSEFMEGICQI